jgi:Ca2+-binding EF-hand superfamily protein
MRNIVGVFSALGVPLMGLAMADCTRILLTFGDPEKAKEQIQAKVSKEELDMMTKFGLDDGTGKFTRTEFIILSMMRLRVLTPSGIQEMNDRFNTLDIARTGFLNIENILKHEKKRSITELFSTHKNIKNSKDRLNRRPRAESNQSEIDTFS